MESANLLILLERVLSGRPGDPQKYSEAYNKLHAEMLNASEGTIRAALITTKALQDKGEINKTASEKFLDYLRQVKEKKKPTPPDLSYLTFSANPACKSSAKLFHFLIRLSNVRTSLLRSGFHRFSQLVEDQKSQVVQIWNQEGLKNFEPNSVMSSLLKNMRLNKGKAFLDWRSNKKSPNLLIIDVVKKAELRYFYIKFLAVERWLNETWDFQDRYIEEEGVGKIVRKRVRRPTFDESFSNIKIGEILYHMTTKTCLGNENFDYRVQALSRLLNKDKDWREKMSRLVKQLDFISKLRKQFPITLISFWSQKFIENFDRNKKFEISCENIRKVIRHNKLEVFLRIKETARDVEKENSRKMLLSLIQNSLKVSQAGAVVFEKMKRHEIFYFNKNIKYKKTVLSSLLKSTKNTQLNAFNSWKTQIDFISHTEKSKKVKKFIKILLSSLASVARIPLVFPDLMQKRESCLIRGVINACKNLRFILNVSFQRWLKSNRSQVKDQRRIRRLVIHSLSYIAKTQVKKAISVWRHNQIELQKKRLELSNHRMHHAISKNNKKSVRASGNNLINALKCGGLNRVLSSALKKIFDRTPESYKQRLLNNLKHAFKKKLTTAIRTWHNTVRQIKNLASRKGSEPSVLKSAFNYLNSKFLKFLKPYFDRWVEAVLKNKRKLAFDDIRSLKFFKILKTLPFRIIKIAYNRLTKATDLIEQTLENLYFLMKRKPKQAFDMWRHNAVKSKKLNILNKLRAEQLCRVLKNLPNKMLKKSFNSVAGSSLKLKQTVRNLIDHIKKKIRTRLNNWKEYCSFCNNAELDLNFRLFRFINLLKNPIKKPLRAAFSDLKPEKKNLAKEKAIKNLAKVFQKHLSRRLGQYSKKVREALFEKKFRDKIRGFKLCKFLEFSTRSRLKSIFIEINEWKNRLIQALNTLELASKSRVRISYMRWKSFIDGELRKGAVRVLKIFKVQAAFTRLLKRTLREASTRMMQGATKMEYIMEGLIDGLKGIPRYAIRRWNKVIVEIKEQILMINVRAHKLCPYLKNLAKRISRTALKCIMSAVKVPDNVRMHITGLKRIYQKYPKEPFEIWKKLCNSLRNESLIKDHNIQMFRVFLEKILRRTIKESLDILKRKQKSLHKAMGVIISAFQKAEMASFQNWKNFVREMRQNDVIKALKLKMMKSSLTNFLMKKLRDTFYRILGKGDKFKGTMVGMLNSLNNIPKMALKKWNKVVIELREYEFKVHLRGSKLLNIMSKVSRRTLKQAEERLKGDIFKPNSNYRLLLILYFKRQKPLKSAFDKWKIFRFNQDNYFLLEQLREAKINFCLSKIANRVIRDSIQRMLGGGNKIKGAFYIYMSFILRRPKVAFDKWKNFIFEVRQRKLIDNLRCYKLRNHFNRICIRKLRDASQRIIGGGNKIKGAIENLISGFRNIPGKALLQWSRYVSEVKEKKLLDNFRSEKLKSRLGELVRRRMQRAFKRITGDQNTITLLKSMFRWLENILTTGPKTCFTKWKDKTSEAVKQQLKKTIKAQNLEKIMNRVGFKYKLLMINRVLKPDNKIKQAISFCANTFKKKPKQAFNKLKSFSEYGKRKGILSELAGERLRNFLKTLLKRKFNSIFKQVAERNEKMNGALANIVNKLKSKPKQAVQKWHKNVENLKKEECFSFISGLSKFSSFLKTFLLSRKKQAFSQLIQHMFQAKNVMLKFRSFHKVFAFLPKSALSAWKTRAQQKSSQLKQQKLRAAHFFSIFNTLAVQKTQFDQKKCQNFRNFSEKLKFSLKNLTKIRNNNLRKDLLNWKLFTRSQGILKLLKGQKLRNALSKLFSRVLKDASQRILRNDSKAAVKIIVQKMQKKHKAAFDRWRQYLILMSNKNLFQQLTGQRFKTILQRLSRRTLVKVFRSLAVDKNSIKSAINTVINNLAARPRQVIKKWKSAIQCIREKALIDFFRGEKLATFAEKVVQRTRNDMFTRLADRNMNSLMVYLNLRWVQKVLQQKPRNAFNKWKVFKEEQQRKKLLFDIKSHKLSQKLGKAGRKKLRDYIQRILGEGDKVKGAIKALVSAMKTKSKEAFVLWKQTSDFISTQIILKKLKSQKFNQGLFRVLLRTLRHSFKRVVEDEDKVKLAINTVVVNLQVKPRQVIKKWKLTLHLLREKVLMQDVTSEKLRRCLDRICKRTVKKSFHRINSVQSNSVLAGINLKWINKILQKVLKFGFDRWKELVVSLTKKNLADKIVTEKMKFCLSTVARRTFKGCFQRVVGEGDRVKGALKAIYMKINRLPQLALVTWKRSLDVDNKKIIFNELRLNRLGKCLSKISKKNDRILFQKITGSQTKARKIINDLLVSLKNKQVQAISKLKLNTQSEKLNSIKKYTSGKVFQDKVKKLFHNKSNQFFDSLKALTRTSGIIKLERFSMISKKYEKHALGSSFNDWKRKTKEGILNEKLIKTKGQLIKNTLSSALRSTQRKAVKSIAHKESVLRSAFGRAEASYKSLTKSKLSSWQKSTFYSSPKKSFQSFKALQTLQSLSNKKKLQTFTRITKPGVVQKTLKRLVSSSQSLQRSAMQAFSENMRKKRLLGKVQGTLRLYQVVKPKPKIMVKGRFNYWKNLEELRLYRLKKKSVMKWIYMSSINYQNSFWKLKFVWNKRYKYFDPRHAMIYRNLCKIGNNYQTRLKQYAHFKLVMHYKTMPYPVKRLAYDPNVPVLAKRNSEHRALAFIMKPENIQTLSRVHTPIGYREAFVRACTPTGYRGSAFRAYTPTGMRVDSPGL